MSTGGTPTALKTSFQARTRRSTQYNQSVTTDLSSKYSLVFNGTKVLFTVYSYETKVSVVSRRGVAAGWGGHPPLCICVPSLRLFTLGQTNKVFAGNFYPAVWV
jgi:hypothetical protein